MLKKKGYTTIEIVKIMPSLIVYTIIFCLHRTAICTNCKVLLYIVVLSANVATIIATARWTRGGSV